VSGRGGHWVAGIHAVRTALKHGADRVEELLVDGRRNDRRLRAVLDEARQLGVTVTESDRKALDRLSAGANHQGVVARTAIPTARNEADLDELLAALKQPPLLLVLDGVTDPHNLGACLRTADAAGVHAVIAPRDKSVGLTPVVCKVASGAAESVPFVQVTNLARTLRHLQEAFGVFLVGAAGESDRSLYQADLTGPLALVMGAEGAGMRRLTREHCDLLVALPMLGGVESLNVSVATGVCLYEALRQRS
jgi:23S rRNA (guanosine2251-2'-O)-methyltransferase